MARTVTLTQLENRVLQRCNLKAGTNNIQILDTGELDSNINEGTAEFWSLLASVDEQPYYLEQNTFVTQSNVSVYAIGPGQAINVTDYYKINGLDVSFGQNIVRSARPYMWKERNRFKWLGAWNYATPVFYRMLGKSSAPANAALDSISFIGQPGGNFSLTMYYLPTPPVLVNPTDTFDGVNGFEEYIVLSAAVKLLLKQEQFEHAQVLIGERERQKDRIIGDLGVRDQENPSRVNDVENNDDWIGPGY